ncbi:hypothetical protein HMPREF1549_03354 [Actinomyces johnsonii F0510]|uniref:Uncharacterized protein n=1 Tax=Actinomyces johnsonii F0510 TaxID=1227262 RepID=U1R5R1_9ACTO|nr:hypothetical protein HMPREF1549_03354 [Actinomyces johnsonii F0510]
MIRPACVLFVLHMVILLERVGKAMCDSLSAGSAPLPVSTSPDTRSGSWRPSPACSWWCSRTTIGSHE